MYFSKTLESLIMGRKWQTRRLVHPGETLVEVDGVKTVFTKGGRIKYQVGRDYAVQRFRGESGLSWTMTHDSREVFVVQSSMGGDKMNNPLWRPLRFEMLNIRQELVCDISRYDAIAEGCIGSFVVTPQEHFQILWDSINREPYAWHDNPQVFAYTLDMSDVWRYTKDSDYQFAFVESF